MSGLCCTWSSTTGETAGRGSEPLDTMMYSVSIRDNQGVKHKLSLTGMDRITTNPGTVDIGGL